MEVVKGELALKLNAQPAQYDAIHRALLAGLLSQVAKRKEQGEYLGANGTKMFIHPGIGPVQGAAGVDRERRAGARPPRSMRATWRASSRRGSSRSARTW